MKMDDTLRLFGYMERHRKCAPKILFLRKAATLSLLFSFSFSPVLTFGQEIPQSIDVQAEANSNANDTPVIVEIDSPEVDEGPLPPVENSSSEEESETVEELPESEMMAMSSGSTQAEGGALFINNESTKSAAPDVDTQTGALSYKYPISIPPGRVGMEPDLSLQYSSNDLENSNPFGYGWSVSIPSIKRTNNNGVNNLYSSDTYTSSIDGELIRVGTSTTFVPRIENGSFRQYAFDNNTWTTIDKDGTKSYFGTTTSSRLSNTASSTQIYSWHVEEAIDTNGNYIKYNYYKDAGTIYPDSISYTGKGSDTGLFLISFSRETRPDNLVSYETGFAATSTYRINKIEAKVDGTWVFKYDLAYSSGHNGNRSLLTSIVKSGQDTDTSVVTLPATNFTYETYSGSDKGWLQDTGVDVPVNVVRDRSNQDDGARFLDINGDSLPDIIRSYGVDTNPTNPGPGHNIAQEVFIHDGTDWATSTQWTIPTPYDGRFGFVAGYLRYDGGYSAYNVDVGARFADVNGDGYSDILWSYHTSDVNIPAGYSYDYDIRDVYINNKVDGWATTTTWTLPTEIRFGEDASDAGGRIADINGDGLPDLLATGCSAGGNIYFNNGAGWSLASTSWAVPVAFGCGTDSGARIADVNGDGLADIVQSYSSTHSSYPAANKVYINTGAGWSLSSWSIPVAFAYSQSSAPFHYSLATRIVDINGDNLPDIISSTDEGTSIPDGDYVYINTGEGWTSDTSNWTLPSYFKFTYTSNSKSYYAESGYAEVDFDGDNLIDFIKSGMVDSYPAYPLEEKVMIHKGKVPDLLKSIEYPEGGKISATYEQSARYRDSSGNIENPVLASNLNTVQTIIFEDQVSDAYSNIYKYGGGEQYFASSTDKKFAGFATTTREDAFGNVTTTYIHQGNETLASLGEFNDTYGKIGKPYLIEIADDNENLYTRTINKWDSSTTTSRDYVFNSLKIEQQYDGDSDHKDIATEYIYDEYGNVRIVTEWGEVTATSTDGLFTDQGSDKRTSTYEFASSTTSYIRNLPASLSITDQSASKIKERKWYYDGLSLGNVELGNLTKEEDWIESFTYSPVLRTYDIHGLVLQEVNSRGATTTYAYDEYSLYPETITNALGQVASSTYDYSSGKVIQSTDVNGYASEFAFDGFDRMVAESLPHPDTGIPVLATEYEYVDVRDNASVQTEKHLNASTTVSVYTYYDGFGRKIQERAQTEDEDIYAVTDWIYGSEGLLSRQSLPYFSEDASDSEATDIENLLTFYEYDPLKRTVRIENVSGDTATSFDQWRKVVTNPLLNVREYEHDAYGRLTTVEEHTASSTYTTAYEWDLNDGLLKITDANGNERSFTYDGLGRRLLAEDLHDSSDTSYGTWNYEYDSVGNLITTTDPKTQVVEYTYDLLNRKLTGNYLGGFGVEEVYLYDSCSNGIGRLCSATTSSSVSGYTYSPNGLVSSESRIVDGKLYVTGFAYNRVGNLIEITYPDGSMVRYEYNSAGRIESVDRKEPGGIYNPLVIDLDYAPHGLVKYQENANRSYTTNVYDHENLYRLGRKIVQTLPSGEGSESLMMFSGNTEDDFEELMDVRALFTEDGSLKESPALSKSQAVQNQKVSTSYSATTSPQTIGEGVREFPSMSDNAKRLKSLPQTAPELTLKAPPERHIGKLVREGVVRYAFKTNLRVDALGVDPETVKAAKKAGVVLGDEVIQKRTKYSRTFATNKPKVYVSEILSGDPQYYEDSNGEWWLAEYGITTEESYEKQVKASRKTSLGKQLLDTIISFVMPARAYASSGTFYPDPDAESSSVDGYVHYEGGSWSSVRNASSGGSTDNSQYLGVKDERITSSRHRIERSIILFDTSSLPDSAIVTNAELSLQVASVSAPGGNTTIYVVPSNPGSSTALGGGDYSSLGSTLYGQTDGSYSGTEVITFNEDGKSAVSKTGLTKLGLRTHNDRAGIAPSNSTELYVVFASADTTGVASDPKLVVTYGFAPSVATALRARQVSTPQEITGIVPEFSAVFADPDSGDTGSAYQIQVSTSGTDWSSPVWDTGKQEFDSPLANGARSPEVTYEGSALALDVPYFWRMKFWDASGTDSLWSTTTVSFTLLEPPAPILDYVYGYDAVGNITSITDISDLENIVSTVYEYDDLYRLTSAATTTSSISYTEDTFGGSITIQPNPSIGKDTYYGTTYVEGGAPTSEIARIGGWGDEYFAYFQFPLDDVYDDEDIESASLYLYNQEASTAYNEAKLYRITSSWTESGVTEVSNPSSTEYSSWLAVPDANWLVADVTQLIKDWENGTYTNHGIKVDALYNSTNHVKAFRTSDYLDPAYRPKLVITGYVHLPGIPDISVGTTTAIIESFSYDPIGNLTSKSGIGAYVFDETGYANPHAATSIASTTLAYDANGNLSSYGTSLYGWDYRNRMASSTVGSLGTTYGYDHSMLRVSKTMNSVTTAYPNQYFQTQGATTTAYIWAGDNMVATVNGNGVSTTTEYSHADHLGSTKVMTDSDSKVMSTINYLSFGSESVSSGEELTDRGFIGQFTDREQGISYLNARYYDGGRGQFLSQDPSFLDIGGPGFEQNYQRTLQQHLMNPQALNSYSYGLNNPITNKDPEGEIVPLIPIALGALAFYGGYSAGTDLYEGYTNGNNGQLAWGAVGAAGSLVPGGSVAKAGAQVAKNRVAGALGEKAAGIVKNTQLIPSVTKPGTSRIPDILDHSGKVIGDVKNVNYQSFTSQLKDFASYAQSNSYKFTLTIDQRTQLSKTLQQLGKQLEVIRKKLE